MTWRVTALPQFAYELVLEVDEENILNHPGVVKLVRAALDYRRANGVIIMAGPERLNVRLDDPAAARLPDRSVIETDGPVDAALLRELDESGLTWAHAFGAGQSVAV